MNDIKSHGRTAVILLDGQDISAQLTPEEIDAMEKSITGFLTQDVIDKMTLKPFNAVITWEPPKETKNE